ncbi:hypothetical protein, partial [Staphylococcus aureus]|uniref:hypothetical protein n=1 Tax=Staphylococcus aureus TaxID=1280 RepID=UPI0037D9FF29
MLKPLRHPYQPHHPINISHQPIQPPLKLTNTYLSHPFLPDKPIHLIHQPTSKLTLNTHTTPNNLKQIQQQI